jgi:pimeloyl-ACP methyl ester carboxylesterase
MSPTTFVTTADGSRTAYDVRGAGPALLLLHGAGQTRRDWHTAGYVERLQTDFTVISIDIRGAGESDSYETVADFAIEKIIGDLLAVADACQAARFSVWGFSLGGMIARYLAASSERVTSLILTGSSLQRRIDDHFREFTNAFALKWEPILALRRAAASIPPEAEKALAAGIPARLAFFRAICDWPDFSPCAQARPTLLFAGSEDKPVMTWLREYPDQLELQGSTSIVLPGLDHSQSFSAMDQTLPLALKFLQSQLSLLR